MRDAACLREGAEQTPSSDTIGLERRRSSLGRFYVRIRTKPALEEFDSSLMDLTSALSWASLYLISEWIIRLSMLVVIPFRRSPEAAKGWLLFGFFLPWPAVALYLLILRPDYPQWRRVQFAKLPHVLKGEISRVRELNTRQEPDLPPRLQRTSNPGRHRDDPHDVERTGEIRLHYATVTGGAIQPTRRMSALPSESPFHVSCPGLRQNLADHFSRKQWRE
jgi:hypothetical protein